MTMVPMLLAGIGDFFNSIMTPLHAAMSFVLMWAYRFWSMIIGADQGVTWAVSIMTLVVVVRTMLIPLFIRQINSARNMQLIQPKIKALQEKYGADRQKLAMEQQKLMKEEGVSATASCVPLLLQMPIFFALYQVLYAAANGTALGYFFQQNPELVQSLVNAKFMGASLAGHFWLSDWSQFGATQVLALILVVLMTGLLFLSQRQLMSKNMPPEALTGPMAQQQKMMLYVFPFIYLFMGAMIPVGVLVYWVTNNLWTFVQQWILIHNNPTPGTPAYVDWEERMIKQGKDPKQIAEERRAKRQGKRNTTTTTTSRTVGGAPSNDGKPNPNGPRADGGGNQPPASDPNRVARQQIQRQQPNRQSRSGRTVKKKDDKSK
ncbi:MAG: membrane protein insertase YidC [Propionibacteriaceae bacterium]|jgi:YidC/Oxa1 family membrane protein insertase|nr:membrane protein insertase YidC [Propionibacteriaceae bacterium]